MNFYLTGGVVRDHLLYGSRGSDAKDFDFAVEAPSYEDMRAELLRRGVTVWTENPKCVGLRGYAPYATFGDFDGFVRVPHDKPYKLGFAADFTLCRRDGAYSDKRHPDSVEPCDLATDLARRDFTMNAVAVSENGTWVDPFGGTMDADAKYLRAVGAARLRFDEDPLRMLRAVRFMVVHDLVVDDDVAACLSTYRGVRDVGTLPKERVMDELNKAFAHDWMATMSALLVKFPNLGFVVSGMGLKLKATT